MLATRVYIEAWAVSPIAFCVILAIRTAKWGARSVGRNSEQDLDVEVEHSSHLANRVLSTLLSPKASLF